MRTNLPLLSFALCLLTALPRLTASPLVAPSASGPSNAQLQPCRNIYWGLLIPIQSLHCFSRCCRRQPRCGDVHTDSDCRPGRWREGPYWWSGGKICTISLISELLGAAIKFLKNNNRLRLLQLQQTERGDPCPPGELSRWHKTVLFVQCLPARLFRWKRFCIFLSPSHRPSPFLTYLFLLYPKKEEEVRCRVLACLLNPRRQSWMRGGRRQTPSFLPPRPIPGRKVWR